MLNNLMDSNVNVLGANHFVVDIGEYKVFYSYESMIAAYNKEQRRIYLKNDMWDYSNTTRKYFKSFVESYTTVDYDTKAKFLKLISENDRVMKIA